MPERNVIIISPHPDDLEIGMGGTAAKLIESGVKVISIVVTDGRRSTSVYGLGEDEVAKLRESEVREAVGILGIDYLIQLGLTDMKSDDNVGSCKSALAEAIRKFRPGEIYIPHPEIDKHPTHRAVSSVALETMKGMPAGEMTVKPRVWCYEVWTPFPSYDRIEDISLQMHVKTAAIDAHRSQVEYKDYTDGIRGLNRYRAVFNETAGFSVVQYAEVFIELKL
ncbi:MAG TPA: PIG-L deacetylase family protein [Thermodesulfobacteriota bacterium]|nr:PIG-L deacetylase family protein [Thermodesulfobacteriota bacterium]